MEKELETIFAHAVALDQAGRMRNTIYCYGREVYILNFDKTILLRFELSNMVKPFDSMLGFNANDYDSSKFSEQDGKIVFARTAGGFERKKSCAVPGKNFNEVKALFQTFWNKEYTGAGTIVLNREITELIQDDLSHIEIFTEAKKLVLLQRDIYSGTIIRLERKKESGLKLVEVVDEITTDFGPIGIRTNDLLGLFTFSRELKMDFADGLGFTFLQGMGGKMTGILSWCLYDEMGQITEVKNDGRQEPQERNDQPSTGGPAVSRRRKVL